MGRLRPTDGWPRADLCQEEESCREFSELESGHFVRGPFLQLLCVSVGFFEMKMKYDESDNVLIRASRALTDKVTDLLGECDFRAILSSLAAARSGS